MGIYYLEPRELRLSVTKCQLPEYVLTAPCIKIMKIGLVTFIKVEEGDIYLLFKLNGKFVYFVERNKSIFN